MEIELCFFDDGLYHVCMSAIKHHEWPFDGVVWMCVEKSFRSAKSLGPIRAWVWRCLQVYHLYVYIHDIMFKFKDKRQMVNIFILHHVVKLFHNMLYLPNPLFPQVLELKQWRVNLHKRHPPKRGRFGDPVNPTEENDSVNDTSSEFTFPEDV